jgi:predicted unusual protein kinase regulating ubiquinone biosynthesis (AarF/ABC1/UbiB family)
VDSPAEPSQPRPARSLHLSARYRRVTFFFAALMVRFLLWDVVLRRVGFRWLARRTAIRRYRAAARSFRTLATRMGGVWIKVGQFLSARVDVLPAAITDELAGLQDEVPAESFGAIEAVLNQGLAGGIQAHFSSVEPDPLASASLGQVHRAQLLGGEEAVVKIQRPNIRDLISVDLDALARVIAWLKRYKPISRRADLDALFGEFRRTLWEEVDYEAEGRNAVRFAEMFRDDPSVRIPSVYPEHSSATVLTLEDVYAIKITDYESIDAAGVERSEVAERLFETYLRQIFIEGFFHADPHPGNLFVQPDADGSWRLVFVDFGMVGCLTEEAKSGLRDLAIAVGTRDAARLTQSYVTLGVLLPGADLARIRQAEEMMFDQVWGRSMQELTHMDRRTMHQFAHQFRDLMYEMPFQVPTDLIFLGRCVAILSGMCTGLNPDFNLFEGLAPFARRLMADEEGEWLDLLLQWLTTEGRALSRLPERLDQALTRMERGELMVTARASPSLERRLRHLSRSLDRLVGAVVFAAILLVGALLYTNGDQLLGGIGLGLAILSLLWVLRP